jgi:hypothetical protein
MFSLKMAFLKENAQFLLNFTVHDGISPSKCKKDSRKRNTDAFFPGTPSKGGRLISNAGEAL